LPEDSHLLLQVIAVDEAGNVASETAGFSVNAEHVGALGCAGAGGDAGAQGPWALGLLALGLGARAVRRRRRAAATATAAAAGLVAFAAATPTHAALLGSWESGPATADGASLYYNPAGLSLSVQTFEAYLALGAAMISVDYARAGQAPGGGPY